MLSEYTWKETALETNVLFFKKINDQFHHLDFNDALIIPVKHRNLKIEKQNKIQQTQTANVFMTASALWHAQYIIIINIMSFKYKQQEKIKYYWQTALTSDTP